MGQWRDNFRLRFDGDRKRVERAERLEDHHNDLIKSKGPALWQDLRDSLAAAAKDISGTEAFLKYECAQTDMGEQASLHYARGFRADRVAELTLCNDSLHVLVRSYGGTLLSENYGIIPNKSGDGVCFAKRDQAGLENAALVTTVLNALSQGG